MQNRVYFEMRDMAMRRVRPIVAGILTAALTLGLCASGALAAGSGEDFTLGIYFTVDLYGKWYSVDPNTGKSVGENYLKVAAAMAGQGTKNDAKLLIDAGSSAQGPAATYFMNMERGETGPVALSLRYAGYDAFLPGSCERELSEEVRKDLYNSLTDPAGTLSGASVAVLQAKTEEKQEERTAPFLVRSYPVGGGEFRVGLVSMEKAGDWQQFRESQSCDLVVAVIPSGVLAEKIADVVEQTAGIDLVLMNGEGVSGVISLRDAQGKRVPVVRGGGGTLMRTEILVEKNGSFTVGKSESMELTSRRNDDGLGALLAPYYETAKSTGGQELGILSGAWDWETDLACVQSDTMNLVHEAQLWAAKADVSITAPLTEGNFCVSQLLEGQKTASMDYKTCYAIYPNENDRLLTVEMTGGELKAWLEDSAGRYTALEDGSISGEAGISQAYGISYTLCLGNPVGERVVNMTYQGKAVTEEQTFQVAVSEGSLVAAGAGGKYPILWRAVHSENFHAVGGSVTYIIGKYAASLAAGYKQLSPPKARSRWTVTAGSSSQVMAPVTRLEFVEALNAAAGSPKAKVPCAFFSDIRRTSLDLTVPSVLDWAVEAGVVQGNGGGQFNPNDPISREQAAIMLLRYDLARNMGPSGSWAVAVPYTDATEISAWASEAIMWNVIRGYLPDNEEGNFCPQAAVTALELEGIMEKLEG